jgi:copper chaperone CopZ
MSCHNCENKIKENIRFVKGVTAVNPSVEQQKVVVKYNSDKTDVTKITAAFKKIGYTATEFDPNAAKTEKKACTSSCCQKK